MYGIIRSALLAILILLLPPSRLSAQESVNSAGGEATGLGGSASYSTGQVVFTAISSATGTVVQGVQQPWEIFVYPGIDEQIERNEPAIVFPNPTNGLVTIKIQDESWEKCMVSLWDNQGQMLLQCEFNDRQFDMDLSLYARSVYFIRITSAEGNIKVFRIVKN